MIALSNSQIQIYVLPLIYETMTEDIAEKAVAEFTEEGEFDGWGLFDEDILIGFIGLGAEISPKKVWLGYFAVNPHYQGRGYGSIMIKFVEEVARKRGYHWLIVETYDNPIYESAIRFYTKHNYKEIGRLADYLIDDSDAIYFRKVL